MIKEYDSYRVVKYGHYLWVIISPDFHMVKDSNGKVVFFDNKEQTIQYCKDNNLKVGE